MMERAHLDCIDPSRDDECSTLFCSLAHCVYQVYLLRIDELYIYTCIYYTDSKSLLIFNYHCVCFNSIDMIMIMIKYKKQQKKKKKSNLVFGKNKFERKRRLNATNNTITQ